MPARVEFLDDVRVERAHEALEHPRAKVEAKSLGDENILVRDGTPVSGVALPRARCAHRRRRACARVSSGRDVEKRVQIALRRSMRSRNTCASSTAETFCGGRARPTVRSDAGDLSCASPSLLDDLGHEEQPVLLTAGAIDWNSSALIASRSRVLAQPLRCRPSGWAIGSMPAGVHRLHALDHAEDIVQLVERASASPSVISMRARWAMRWTSSRIVTCAGTGRGEAGTEIAAIYAH